MKEQIFNVGDKLLCKKDYITVLESFHNGKEYVISEILLNAWIVTENEKIFYYIKDDNGRLIEIRYEAAMNEFFCTKQDIRKLKLEKIYENSEY